MPGQSFGLVELAFALFHTMQRHRNNRVPSLLAQARRGRPHQQIGQERLEPERALVFVTVNDFEHHAARRDGRAGAAELQSHLAAVAALERRGDRALERQSATFAKRWRNEFYVLPALHAVEQFTSHRRRTFFARARPTPRSTPARGRSTPASHQSIFPSPKTRCRRPAPRRSETRTVSSRRPSPRASRSGNTNCPTGDNPWPGSDPSG